MSFVRPELAVQLNRWREVAIFAGVILIGILLIGYNNLFFQIIGLAVAGIGVALILPAIPRALTRKQSDGAGMVEIDEREITYLAAHGGGVVSIDALFSVGILPTMDQEPEWHLTQDDGARLTIPADALGADALIDAVLALPGADTDAALRALRQPSADVTTVWRKNRLTLH
jgi:hypothetical protein